LFEKELFGCTFNIAVLAVCVAATASDVMVAVGGLYSDDDADDDDDNTSYNNGFNVDLVYSDSDADYVAAGPVSFADVDDSNLTKPKSTHRHQKS